MALEATPLQVARHLSILLGVLLEMDQRLAMPRVRPKTTMTFPFETR
jgi:hypothetical protein